jgi:hypothetical protein
MNTSVADAEEMRSLLELRDEDARLELGAQLWGLEFGHLPGTPPLFTGAMLRDGPAWSMIRSKGDVKAANLLLRMWAKALAAAEAQPPPPPPELPLPSHEAGRRTSQSTALSVSAVQAGSEVELAMEQQTGLVEQAANDVVKWLEQSRFDANCEEIHVGKVLQLWESHEARRPTCSCLNSYCRSADDRKAASPGAP